jgi:hypothetical protein
MRDRKKSGAGTAIVKLGKAHVAIVLDESPSMDDRMGSLRDPAIRGVNDQVAAIRATTSTDAGVSLLQFSGSVRTVYADVDLGKVRQLTRKDYVPENGSGTALYDGVHEAITLLEPKVKDDETALVVIVTDGDENCSMRNDVAELARRIAKKQMTGRWTFVLLGPKATAARTGEQLGIPPGNVQTFDLSPAALAAGFDQTKRSMGRYMSARDSGVASTEGFYLNPKQDE